MTNPFADYGKQATSQRAAPLVGPIKTRAASRERYVEIVQELHRFSNIEDLEIYLLQHRQEIAQFRAELGLYWHGDGNDFPGLRKEIERARVRLDDGLDWPRYAPTEEGLGL